MNEDLKKLRKTFDGDDQFMSAFQVVTIRRQPRKFPVWALDNKLTQVIINRAFPNWRKNKTQRKRAARWARVIVLYYRNGMPFNHVSRELGLEKDHLRSLLRAIRRAAIGQRANGSGPRTR